MAETSFPWEDIDTTETQYSTLFRTLNNGVNGTPTTDELEVVAGFIGLTVDVEPGQAMVQGHYYINTVAKNIELDTADPVNDRIDTIVLRLDDIANEIVAVAVTGTPAVSPVPPTLTQTEPYGVFEFPLADVLVEANAGVPGAIVDRRQFMGERFGVWTTDLRPDPGTGVAIGYNSTLDRLEFYDGSQWRSVAPESLGEIGDVTVTAPTSGDKLVFDGTNWVNLEAYAYVDSVYYTSNGSFVKADYPWLRAIRVKMVGAGGGGSFVQSASSGRDACSGSGGGGAYAESFITDIAGLDASVAVTVGAGVVNNPGGSSIFGSNVVLAVGGNDGASRTDTAGINAASGGRGGLAEDCIGDFTAGGNGATSSLAVAAGEGFVGASGGSVFGGGRDGSRGATVPSPGELYGGGGRGGYTSNGGPSQSGAPGGNGIVIVELYA